jgi:phosphoglycolate phosphatase
MRFELFVFDFDGTLADSRLAILHSMAQALRACDVTPAGADAGFLAGLAAGHVDPADTAEWLGLPLDDMVTHLLGGPPGKTHRQVLAAYRAVYPSMCSVHTRLFDGMEPLLQRARDGGIRLAIATNKGSAALRHAAGHLGIWGYFELVRTVESERYPKPHPEMMLSLLEEARVPAHRALMVGDTAYDVAMAKGAGVACAAVTYGTHDAQRLREAGAQYMVRSAAELWPILLAA